MRIVGGKFRGKALTSPEDDSIRPTADRTRESVFNILASRLGPNFDGLRVLVAEDNYLQSRHREHRGRDHPRCHFPKRS